MNLFKTFVLMIAMMVLFIVVGAIFGGAAGALLCFAIATAINFWAYWNSDKAVLRMYGARELAEKDSPVLFALVRQLAGQAKLPMPKVYFMEDAQPNAFATGRDPEHSAVCVTRGLLESMNNYQLAGVIAHELGHIKHRDTLTMTLVATMAGAMQILLSFGARRSGLGILGIILVQLLAPLAAILVQMSISRAREFEADRAGAEITGNPLWLASALGNLEPAAKQIPNRVAQSNPATAHMFIVNPLSAKGVASWFSSHPSTDQRIARLRQMSGVAAPKPQL